MKSTPHVSGRCVHRRDLKHINDIKSNSWRETLCRDLNPFLFGLHSIFLASSIRRSLIGPLSTQLRHRRTLSLLHVLLMDFLYRVQPAGVTAPQQQCGCSATPSVTHPLAARAANRSLQPRPFGRIPVVPPSGQEDRNESEKLSWEKMSR